MVAKEKENNITAEESSITEEQVKLILQLYKEFPAFGKQYSQEDLVKLTKTAGNTHIQLILDWKKNQNGKTETRQENLFSDAGFGMIYKLCWKNLQELKENQRMPEQAFVQWVFSEYQLYVRTRLSVKQAFNGKAVE